MHWYLVFDVSSFVFDVSVCCTIYFARYWCIHYFIILFWFASSSNRLKIFYGLIIGWSVVVKGWTNLCFLFFRPIVKCVHVSRRILTPVYWHGHPYSGTQKIKYTFIYTILLHCRLCFFLLNLSEVYFSVRKHTFSIVNHHTDHQHFNTELQLQLLCVLQPL